jgi:hypothetical protein
MNSKKLLSCGALAFGILSFIIGVIFVVTYVSQAVIARLGEPDQSLLFWYLPILFIGIIGVFLGLGAGVLGFIGWRRNRNPDVPNENPIQ